MLAECSPPYHQFHGDSLSSVSTISKRLGNYPPKKWTFSCLTQFPMKFLPGSGFAKTRPTNKCAGMLQGEEYSYFNSITPPDVRAAIADYWSEQYGNIVRRSAVFEEGNPDCTTTVSNQQGQPNPFPCQRYLADRKRQHSSLASLKYAVLIVQLRDK